MADGMDTECVPGLGNDQAVIAGAQAELSGEASLQLLDVAFPSACETKQGIKDALCGGLIEAANVSPGPLRPLNVEGHLCPSDPPS